MSTIESNFKNLDSRKMYICDTNYEITKKMTK